MAKDPNRHPVAPVHLEIQRGGAGEAVHAEILRRVNDGFSGAIIVEKDGLLALKAGYGWANRERQVPFSPATIAQIGSLTKQFTAAAVVAFSLEGRIDFSKPLSTYLPGVPLKAAGMTIHQLLTHTAGLPDSCGDDFDRLSRDELTTRCLEGIDRSRAGEFAYSNLGYSLLAALVESVSGVPFEDTLAGRFFDPLGMARTGYFFGDDLQDSLAYGYEDSTSHPPISDQLRILAPDFWNLKGNGGMQASAEDMYTWYRAFALGPGVGESLRRVMIAPYAPSGDGVAYGYGWFVRSKANGEIEQASHTGGDGVFFAAIVWRPLERVFFYLVSNVGNEAGADTASQVLRILRKNVYPQT